MSEVRKDVYKQLYPKRRYCCKCICICKRMTSKGLEQGVDINLNVCELMWRMWHVCRKPMPLQSYWGTGSCLQCLYVELSMSEWTRNPNTSGLLKIVYTYYIFAIVMGSKYITILVILRNYQEMRNTIQLNIFQFISGMPWF